MKKLFLLALLLAGTLSSCSKNEITESYASNDIEGLININISSGITKGVNTTTSILKTEGKEVTLYAFGPETDGAAKAINYKYTSTDWINTDDIHWTNIGLPGAFYSLHDGENPLELTIATNVDSENDVSLTTATAVEAFSQGDNSESKDHTDIIFHRSVLQSIPTGDNINVYHDHALSKINIYAGTTLYYNAYIARVRFVNIGDGSTVTISATDGSQSVSWSETQNVSTFNYFTYANATTNNSNCFSGEDASLIWDQTNDNSMMIIPQELEGVTKTEIDFGAITSKHSYIEVIYCLTKKDQGNTETNYIGWKSASDRSSAGYTTNINTNTDSSVKYSYVDTNNNNSFDVNDGDYLLESDSPLYVMAAFPINHEFKYNTAYDITLGLGIDGSTGGLNLYDGYVDKNGNPIILDTTYEGGEDNEDDELPEPGDLMFPNIDNEIGILIEVNNWNTSDGYNIY